MAKRIQRQRTKGWKMPTGAVYVGRPTMWGNPYWDIKRYGLDLCLALFADTARGIWDPATVPSGSPDMWWTWLYANHMEWLKRIGHKPVESARLDLKGHDLACWCPLNHRCHADILLEIANQ